MIKQHIIDSLSNIVTKYSQSKSIIDNFNFSVEVPPKNINADFASNVAMLIAKKINMNPKIIAQELSNIIISNTSEFIEKIEIMGPGFINLKVKNEVFYRELKTILRKKNKYGKSIKNNKCKVIIEFVSANPTGPLHVGHGRGAAIGDSISRILKHLGYDVTKEYYLNDVGNQMLILAKSVEARYKQLSGEKIEFSHSYYQGEYILNIAKCLIDEGKNINEINFKYEAVKRILKMIKDDLKDFAIKFDNWFSESNIVNGYGNRNYKTEVDKTCEYLLTKGYAYEKDGALWLASSKFSDDKDRVLRRSSGEYTYFASDVAYHKNKFERGFLKLINIWGADHHGYIARIKSCLRMLNFSEEALNIILYQLVVIKKAGQPLAMSTRMGEFITLREVLDEVGKDACRFFFLMRAPNSQFEFDLDIAKKKSVENPVFYVQYVNARCNSIIRESYNRSDIIRDVESVNFDLLNTEEERDLVKHLAMFCDILCLSEKTMSPHHFTIYLTELANKYHKFYEHCRILTADVSLTSARLKLIEGVMIIVKIGLDLLGVSTPNEM
ncbi:MAG: arginine--tRNA ligase [Endomicrobium sp.]|jgi:arginyl-tRNA synthetase|nr:arginine--tRNA ligase [Endomicrobium sp.]